MNKKALSLAVCLAVSYSSATYALGLGEIESSSHLNQPFRAKINLLSTSAADARRLKIRIASPEVFSRVGIERPKYLDSISFTPSVENGKPIIIVNSNQPINQPFLNFLLEVSWPNGQLLKEYTVLLDPPVLVQPGTAVANNTAGVRAEPRRQQQPVASTKAPQQTTRSTKAVSKKTVAPSRATTSAKKTAKRSGGKTNKYRVVRGDSLYKVAKRLGRKGVRTEQMMMAIYRSNPTAFRKRNVNNLKAGALLRRPSKREALSLSYAKSKSSIYKQSIEWRKYRSKLAKKTVPQSQVRKSSSQGSQTSATKNTQARIEVIGSSSSAVDTKNLSATGSAKIGQLERQLVQANESLAAKANANTELKSRVSELESLLRKKNRLITLKNEQLAELQAKLGVPVSATTTDAQEGSDIRQQVKNAVNQDGNIVRSGEAIEAGVAQQADPIANEQLAVIDGSTEIPSVFDENPLTPAETVDQTAADDTTVTPPELVDDTSAGDNQGGVLDLLSSPLVMSLGGGSLLALLFGWLLMRRRGKSGDYEEYSSIDFDDPEFAPGSASTKGVATKSDKVNPDDAFAGLEGDFDDLDFGDTADTGSSAKEDTSHLDGMSDDILQEADVYIVYGLHDQAEVELKKALEKQPSNLQYHAKLLENYKASSNLDAFNEQAEVFSKLPDDTGANKDELWKTITEWAHDLKSKSSLFVDSSFGSNGVVAGAAAVVAAGGIAVTAGKAFAEDKLDDAKDLFDADSAITSKVDDLDLSGLDDLTSDLDLDISGLQLSDKESFSDDDFDLDDLLSDDGEDETFKISESTSEDLDASSLDDLLDDVDMDTPSLSMEEPVLAEANVAELGSEFEDLLDLDLTDLDSDLSLDSNSGGSSDLGLSNLELELDNDDDLNKILPSNSAYISKKDDATGTDNLLGDLDDDLSFMDLDDDDHDLRETQVSTKLDLARAYLDMGDIEGARNTLEEVMMEGNDDQKKEAEELLHQAG